MFRPRLAILLLALITLAAYLPVIHDDFLSYDDGTYVTNNRIVQNGLTWDGIKWAFTTWRGGFWHPLTWLSHMLDCELFGLNSGTQHYINVLFHTANAVLLLLLLFRFTGAIWASALVAALFAWHPLHTESVAWLSERKDVLSTFFGMLVLLAYTRYASSQCSTTGKQALANRNVTVTPPGLPSVAFFWLAVICFGLGLMAKPMLVTLPFVMLLLDYWPLNRISTLSISSFLAWGRLVLEKWPFIMLSGIASVVASVAERNAGMVAPFQQVPVLLRLENALVSYVRYLGKTFYPTHLSIIYPLPRHLPWSEVMAAAIFLMFVSVLAWRMRGRCPYLLVGWLWFLGTLVPVIGLVQLNFQSLGDHYTYIPLIGIFIAGAWGMKDLIAQFSIQTLPAVIVTGSVLSACLMVTEYQLSFWRNDEALFGHAVAVTKNNAGARLNLGAALAAEGRLTEALEQFQEAARISPSNALAHIFLGEGFAAVGKTSEALAQSQEARNVLNLNSEQPVLRFDLGLLLTQLGRLNEAMDQYEQAAQFASDNPDLYYEMGRLLFIQNRDADAADKLREALRLDPYNVAALVLLAEILASDNQPQIRNGAEAVALAEKANVLSGGTEPPVLDALAMSYAETGRFKEAQQTEQHAIQLAATAGMETNEMDQRLKLYQSGQPYRKKGVSPQYSHQQ
jgi:tetratricopeptide (TPR) repeat protein